jgi:MoaA/NifB/PqqE/SkfB family radical SAM enzyme
LTFGSGSPPFTFSVGIEKAIMILQWHITEKCNLRCTHCYQGDVPGKELGFDDLVRILDQYRNFAVSRCSRGRGHMTLTGGEPFVRPDFFDLLDRIAAEPEIFTFSILSNGTLIDSQLAGRLKWLRPSYVQISIEGGERIHDAIRGAGQFRRAMQGIRHLARERVPTQVSFTAHSLNYREFPAVVKAVSRAGADYVWTDRLWFPSAEEGMRNSVPCPEKRLTSFSPSFAEPN